MDSDPRAYLQIGEVAERTGVTQRTLRFYEEKGLLKAPSRMEGGFRLYSEEDVRRVEQIRRLKSLLGFSLAEIKDMVEAEEELEQLREEARNSAFDAEQGRNRLQRAIELTEGQYVMIGQKVQQLVEMERTMLAKLEKYRARLAKLEEAEPPLEAVRSS